MVEVGPGGTLSALVRQHPDGGAGRLAVATLRRASEEGSDLALLLDALGRLWVEGVAVRLRGGSSPASGGTACRCRPTPSSASATGSIRPQGGMAPDDGRPASTGTRADLADWFWAPVWKQAPLAAPAAGEGDGAWLVFLDRGGLGARLAERLRRDGRTVSTVAAGRASTADGEADHDRSGPAAGLRQPGPASAGRGRELPARVLHLWGVTGAEPGFDEAQARGCSA